MNVYNTSKGPVTLDFCKSLSKVELHAHLHGSMRKATLQEFMKARNIPFNEKDFEAKDLDAAFKMFKYIHDAIDSIQQVRRIVREMLEDFTAENTVYLEIRTTPRALSDSTLEEYVSVIINEIKSFETRHPGKLTTRLLLSISRDEGLSKARETLGITKKYFNTGYIVGIDFSGNPHKNTFNDYLEVLEDARKSGLKITVHCAELPDEKTLKETYDVLKFRPDRVGHFNYFNEDLFEKICQFNIPIEMCPTSNKVSMSLKEYKDHHFIRYHMKKHPLSLCTDDTVVLNTSLSEEYYRIFQAFGMNTSEAKEVIERSFDCVFDEKVKEKLRSIAL